MEMFGQKAALQNKILTASQELTLLAGELQVEDGFNRRHHTSMLHEREINEVFNEDSRRQLFSDENCREEEPCCDYCCEMAQSGKDAFEGTKTKLRAAD